LRAKKDEAPRNWLIKVILSRGGRATMRQIAWDGLRGERFQAAKDDAKGFVVFEPYAVRGGVREGQVARLTPAGVWEAIRISDTYDPTLVTAALAAPGIEAILARLERGNHPIAVKIADDLHDAEQWRNRQKRDAALERKEWQTIERVQELLHKLVDKIPSKICKRDIGTLNAFLEKKGQRRIEPKYVMPGETPPPRPAPILGVPAPRPITGTSTPTPSVKPLTDFEEAILASRANHSPRLVPVRNLPKLADTSDDARILALFNGDPYGGELLPNGKIRYDNRDWTLQAWERERFKQAG
jgi:hypothetical protein